MLHHQSCDHLSDSVKPSIGNLRSSADDHRFVLSARITNEELISARAYGTLQADMSVPSLISLPSAIVAISGEVAQVHIVKWHSGTQGQHPVTMSSLRF